MESLRIKAGELAVHLSTTSLSDYISSKDVSQYMAHVLSTIPKPYDTDKLAFTLYANYLIHFLGKKFPLRQPISAISEQSDIPHIVVKHILDTFSEVTLNANRKPRYYFPIISVSFGIFQLIFSCL